MTIDNKSVEKTLMFLENVTRNLASNHQNNTLVPSSSNTFKTRYKRLKEQSKQFIEKQQ